MLFLSNPWFIGIGGGILSGLVVTVITRYLFSKRERKEYFQKIATANNEIIYTIRPTIAEKVIPSDIMLDALFSATASKYSVDESDLHTKITLRNELIKEVMDNTFLSSQQKVDFCELLSILKNDDSDKTEKEFVYITSDSGNLSTILGLLTALTTIFIGAYIQASESLSMEVTFSKYLPLVAVITSVPILLVLFKSMSKINKINSPSKTTINISGDNVLSKKENRKETIEKNN